MPAADPGPTALAFYPNGKMLSIEQVFILNQFKQSEIDIFDQGLSGKILKNFPGLGHTSGRGMNWIGRSSKWIQHDFGGTRKANKARGKEEIQGRWER